MKKNNILKLTDRDWKQFKLETIFKIENCKCSKVSGLNAGKTPYVGATNRNNGVMNFVEANSSLITKGNCIAFICDGEGSVGYSVYKSEDFIGSTTVKVGRNENLNKYNATFITTFADTVRSKYNFGFKRNDKHLKSEILILPANEKGDPDYEFMEAFMKQKELEKINDYYNFIVNRIDDLKDYKEVTAFNTKEWRDFNITSLFNFAKGDQNNMANIEIGTIPLVSAKKGENGCKGFASQKNKKIFPKNSLTLNNDGDGGAGISFYQPYSYLLDSHVTALYPKNDLNRFALLFISRCITAQRDKFGHGYSINNQRLKVFKLMLPVDQNGQPDYDYMENYIKKIEYEKLTKYIERKTTNA